MELPIPVQIHNDRLGMKGTHGTLLQVSPDGYYLVAATFGDKLHRVFLPIQDTVVIFEEPEEAVGQVIEVER